MLMHTCAIVPAAGQGLRMGRGVRKAFMGLDGVPILARTLLRLQSVKAIHALIPVVHAQDVQRCIHHIIAPFGIRDVLTVVAGGQTRQESVYRGLEAAASFQMVVVHDAVRPFVPAELVLNVLEAAARTGAAVAALPAADTVKQVSSHGFVSQTLPRGDIWLAQTPQAFRRELLWEAHCRALQEGYAATDDAALVERLGVPVQVVEGSRSNIKITTPEDLLLAATILQQEGCGTGIPWPISYKEGKSP